MFILILAGCYKNRKSRFESLPQKNITSYLKIGVTGTTLEVLKVSEQMMLDSPPRVINWKRKLCLKPEIFIYTCIYRLFNNRTQD